MKEFKTIWKFFIDHFKFTSVLIIAISVFGIFSMNMMPKEAAPEVNIPIAVVSTILPGANVEDVELFVTKKIEDQVITIEGVDKVESTSSKGLSLITIQFNAEEDMDEKINDVKNAVDLTLSSLPAEALDPVVQKIQLSDTPILVFGIGGEYDLVQISKYAEDVQEEIEKVAKVSKVQVLGAKIREVQILINKDILDGFGLDFETVNMAISQAITNIPIGSIETSNEEFTIGINGQIENLEEIRNIPVKNTNGTIIKISDFAEVLDTYKEQKSGSRMSYEGSESTEAVTIRVFKSAGGDILKMVDEIMAKIESMKGNILPEDIQIFIVEDNAQYIRQDLSDLTESGLQTIFVVMLFLFLFLGWREALIAGISIPLTFFITFSFLSALGYTLNSLTLFSLILSLGILVDSAIVITESINVKIKQGHTPIKSALETIREHQFPLISGVLTTVFAFLPMLLTGGIMGEFIKTIPITISIVLLSSLFVSLAIISSLSIKLYAKDYHNKFTEKLDVFHKRKMLIEEKVKKKYMSVLHHFLDVKKNAKKIYVFLVLGMIISLSLPITGLLKVVMFPPSDNDTIYINISKAIGTTLEESEGIIDQVESFLLDFEEIELFVSNIGSSGTSGSALDGTALSDTHLSNIVIQLKEDRGRSSLKIVEEINQILNENINADIQVNQPSDGPGESAPIEVRVLGDDLQKLDSSAVQILSLLEEMEGTRNVHSSTEDTNGQFVIQIDREIAGIYGVNINQIARFLNSMVSGSKVGDIFLEEDEVEIILKTKEDVSLSEIQGMTINTPSGLMPISSFANIAFEESISSIQRLDGKRVIRIRSYVKPGTAPTVIVKNLEKQLAEIYIPEGVEVKMGGEQEDIQESFKDLARAFVLSIFLIAGLLVLQFNSFKQPLFILASIPFALIGVLPGLFLIGQAFSFPGFIGIVALSGIVVNDAIILIDQINQNRLEGVEKKKAIKSACESRLQPIILTTVTTVCGVLPLALSSPTWGPLAYSIIFGLLFSTVLTLLVIPVFYNQFGEETLSIRHH